jgi:transcriptional regulator with GAF, ATPase, and Fis domain
MSTEPTIARENHGHRREALLRLSETARLQLLLDLTKRITSNLQLREVLRAIAANIREVIQCDAVAVSLPDLAAGKSPGCFSRISK